MKYHFFHFLSTFIRRIFIKFTADFYGKYNSYSSMKKIAPDKWKHFYVGIVLGAIVYRLSILFWPQQQGLAVAVSIAVIIAICYGFELFSLISGRGQYEIKDAIAGIIGGVMGLVLMLFLLW